MKFRMKSSDIGSIQHFSNVLQGIGYLSKNFVLRISQNFMFCIINERVYTGSSLFWCQIDYKSLFLESGMEGLNSENNEILLEVVSDYLIKSLRQCANCRSVKVKLIKNRLDNPCLSIEIEQCSESDNTRYVIHEVPVRIVPLRIWDEYLVPPQIEYDVSIYLPSLKVFRNILDKMKNITGFVTVTATDNGELLLEIKNDQVKMRTQFANLGRPAWKIPKNASSLLTDMNSETTSNISKSISTTNIKTASVTIDIKRLFQVINSIKIVPQKLACNIVDKRCVQVYVLLHDVVIHSIIPGVIV